MKQFTKQSPETGTKPFRPYCFLPQNVQRVKWTLPTLWSSRNTSNLSVWSFPSPPPPFSPPLPNSVSVSIGLPRDHVDITCAWDIYQVLCLDFYFPFLVRLGFCGHKFVGSRLLKDLLGHYWRRL